MDTPRPTFFGTPLSTGCPRIGEKCRIRTRSNTRFAPTKGFRVDVGVRPGLCVHPSFSNSLSRGDYRLRGGVLLVWSLSFELYFFHSFTFDNHIIFHYNWFMDTKQFSYSDFELKPSHIVRNPARLGWKPVVKIEHYHVGPQDILQKEE